MILLVFSFDFQKYSEGENFPGSGKDTPVKVRTSWDHFRHGLHHVNFDDVRTGYLVVFEGLYSHFLFCKEWRVFGRSYMLLL